MIARLLRGGLWLLLYTLLATAIAQAAIFVFLGVRYDLNRTKLVQMFAVLQDVDLFAMKEAAAKQKEDLSTEQVSYQQILGERARMIHHLELREQALQDGVAWLRFERQKLADERKRYRQTLSAFDQQLAEMQQQATSEGMDDNRAKLESIKAGQAKDLLVGMIDPKSKSYAIDDAVTLFKGMPNTKAAKIIGEFKDPEDLKMIAEVLRLIREGTPLADLAAETREKLDTRKP